MADNKGNYKLNGTQVPLPHGPGTGAPFANPGNKGTFQMTGTSIDMPRLPTQQSPSANPKEGIRQDAQASHAPLSRTPVKLISDLNPGTLPFSERAHKQSETA
jgi:hypothetical protein